MGKSRVSDEDRDKDDNEVVEKIAAAHVWARDGEGPHAQVLPQSVEPTVASGEKSSAAADLADLVVMASVEAAPAPAAAPAPMAAAIPAADPATGPDPTLKAPSQTEPQESPEGEEGKEEAEDVSEEDSAEDNDQSDSATEDQEAKPVGDGSPSKNDIAFGYIIPLVLYFVVYIVNVLAGGYCLDSEKMNALSEILFFSAPALCALCLLMGSKWLKVTGAILILPLSYAAFFGAQYYHSFDRFRSVEVLGPYGPLVRAFNANGWRICRYESAWVNGNQPGTTYTREKDAGPGIRYVKKMRMGEPP